MADKIFFVKYSQSLVAQNVPIALVQPSTSNTVATPEIPIDMKEEAPPTPTPPPQAPEMVQWNPQFVHFTPQPEVGAWPERSNDLPEDKMSVIALSNKLGGRDTRGGLWRRIKHLETRYITSQNSEQWCCMNCYHPGLKGWKQVNTHNVGLKEGFYDPPCPVCGMKVSTIESLGRCKECRMVVLSNEAAIQQGVVFTVH